MNVVTNLKINENRLLENFNTLSEIGATVDGGVSRLALSNEDLQARAWLAEQFEAAGLFVRDDDAGNLSGVLASQNVDARTLLIGSHLDTVPNGGRYDSSVGILAALECLCTIRECGIKLPVHLEAIDFTDEEGCWQSLFGSRALTGKLDPAYLHNGGGDNGPFRAALFRAGIRPADVFRARRDAETLHAYLELHIEQGRTLDQAGIDIGVVTGIVGRTTYHLTFFGEAAHSGTTLMVDRRDALLGGARYIAAAYALVADEFPGGVFNCGNIQVKPGAFNVIPSEAKLTIECRHEDPERMKTMEGALIRLAQEHAATYSLSVNVHRYAHMSAARLDEPIIAAVEAACERVGVSYKRIVSYAGHDAQVLGDFTRAGMIFIPSVAGVSHSPKEFTAWPDVVKGANALLHTILILAQSEN